MCKGGQSSATLGALQGKGVGKTERGGQKGNKGALCVWKGTVSTPVWPSPTPDHHSLSCHLTASSPNQTCVCYHCAACVGVAGTGCQLLGKRRMDWVLEGDVRLGAAGSRGCGQRGCAVLFYAVLGVVGVQVPVMSLGCCRWACSRPHGRRGWAVPSMCGVLCGISSAYILYVCATPCASVTDRCSAVLLAEDEQ